MTKLARTRAKAGNNAKIRITKHVRVVWSVGCGSAGWHSGPGRVTRREIFESYSKSCNTLTPPQQPRRLTVRHTFKHVTSVIANEPGLRAYSIRDRESDHGKYNGFKDNMNKRRRESGFRAFNRCVLRRIRENSCESTQYRILIRTCTNLTQSPAYHRNNGPELGTVPGLRNKNITRYQRYCT